MDLNAFSEYNEKDIEAAKKLMQQIMEYGKCPAW